jgi:hypothetical protein
MKNLSYECTTIASSDGYNGYKCGVDISPIWIDLFNAQTIKHAVGICPNKVHEESTLNVITFKISIKKIFMLYAPRFTYFHNDINR